MAQTPKNFEKNDLTLEEIRDRKEKMFLQKIEELRHSLEESQQTVDDQQVLIKELEQTNHARLYRIQELERVINDLEWDVRSLKDDKSGLQNDIATKDQEIYNLESTNRDLQHKVDTANYNSLYGG